MYSLNVMNSGALHTAGGAEGAVIPGMPITIGNFAFRALQFTFSIIAVCVMATASEYFKVTVFGFLIVAGVIQCGWSLAAVLLDLYTWRMGYAIASPWALGFLAVLDFITFTLTFSAACACAGVTILLDSDLHKCDIIMCDRFKLATAMMFISSFTTSVSFTVNFRKSALLIHDIPVENNQLEIKVPCTYGTWTSFISRIAVSAAAVMPVWYMATTGTIFKTYTFFGGVMAVRFISSLSLGIFDLMKIRTPQTGRDILRAIAFLDGVTTALSFAGTNAACGFILYQFHDLSTCVFGERCVTKEVVVIFGYAATFFGGVHVVASLIVLRSADWH